MSNELLPKDLEQFLLKHIDSIAQLEGLLLLREAAEEEWSIQKLASRLYIKEAETAELVRTLWRSHYKLLLWGGLCFLGLTVSNALLVIDKLALPLIDLSAWRLVASLLALLIMLYGMIWDTE